MIIITTDEEGEGLVRTRRVIDRYLPRISSKAWAGKLHPNLYDMMLEQVEMFRLDVAISKITNYGISPLYITENSRVNRYKHVIKTERPKNVIENRLDYKYFIYSVSMLSAVFHDFGKIMNGFQCALRGSNKKRQNMRHEFMSYIILCWLTDNTRNKINENDMIYDTDIKLINAMITGDYLNEVDLFLSYISSGDSKILKIIEEYISSIIEDKRGQVFHNLNSERKLIECVKFVVLTHHKMITYKGGNNGPHYVETDEGDHNNSYVRMSMFQMTSDNKSFISAFKNSSFLPATKKNSVIDKINKRFLYVVRKTSEEILPFLESTKNWDITKDTCVDVSLIARNFMIIGDNKGSSIKVSSDRYNKRDMVFANTTQEGTLADPLIQHLTRVILYTHKALKSLKSEIINIIPGEDTPESISNKSPERFEWQNKAVEATRDYKGGGFIAFVMAGTGSGKTIADMKILSSVCDDIRATTILPLTTLTSQTFQSYKEDMGFTKEQVAIVMGGQVTQRRMDVKGNPDVDTQTECLTNGVNPEEGIDHNYFDVETENYIVGQTVPDVLHGNNRNRKVLDVFLTYPVVACTADMLVPGVDLSHKKGMATYIRSITSDLIIDEIDNYGYEDQVILCRLVYQAGLFGKKVIISSATLSPILVKELLNSYEKGYNNHCNFLDKDISLSVALVSEYTSSLFKREDFDIAYDAFLHDYTSKMILAPVRRRVDTFSLNHDWMESYLNQSRIMHERNKIPGTSSSVGIIRLNRVRDVIELSRHILKNNQDDGIKIVCLHSRFPNGIKKNIERELASLLCRKNNQSPVNNVHFKRFNKDLRVIIIASNIVETGRDFDFDWAITEPCSEQSIVQLAGRVRRHRYDEYDGINISISDTTIKNIERTEENKKGCIMNPGVDTPIITGVGDNLHEFPKNKDIMAITRTTKALFNIQSMNEKLDNRYIINDINENTPLGIRRSHETMEVSFGLKTIPDYKEVTRVSSKGYANDPITRMNIRTYTYRQFRRNEGNLVFLFKGSNLDLSVDENHIDFEKEHSEHLFFKPDVYMMSNNASEFDRKLSIAFRLGKNGGKYGLFTGYDGISSY